MCWYGSVCLEVLGLGMDGRAALLIRTDLLRVGIPAVRADTRLTLPRHHMHEDTLPTV